MATRNATPKVLEIDIVLAGVSTGTPFLTVANPEGRDLLVPLVAPWHTTYNAAGAYAELTVDTTGDGNRGNAVIQVQGEGGDDPLPTTTYIIWPASGTLTLTLSATASAYVGKLYVEYWGSTRTTGSLNSIS